MKSLFILSIAMMTAQAFATPEVKIEKVKSIICQATAHYEEETPGQKTPIQEADFKIFTAGSRSDTDPAPGAFILDEYYLTQGGNLDEDGNQQYYFFKDKNVKINFEFRDASKAYGELTIQSDGSAKGFINQKSHVTELSCILK